MQYANAASFEYAVPPPGAMYYHEPVYESKPQYQRTILSKIAVLATDFIAIVVSLGHLALLGVIAMRNGRDIDEQYSFFQNALTTLAPLFPMVFAFIMGRLLYHVARFRLEKGSTLGTLEQLLGSQTMGAAVATHLKLAAVNPLGLLVLGLWIFSPLGGQSLLRFLHTIAPSYNTPYMYMDLQSRELILRANVNTSFLSAMKASNSTQTSPTDLWGNVKIPYLVPEALNGSQTWYEFPADQERWYTANVGVPITRLAAGNSTLYLESNYIDLDCGQEKVYDPNPSSAVTPYKDTLQAWVWNRTKEKLPLLYNGSWYGDQQREKYHFALDRFVDNYWTDWESQRNRSIDGYSLRIFENETEIDAGPTNLLYQDEWPYTLVVSPWRAPGRVSKSQCRVLQKYVESRVSCFSSPQQPQPDCIVVAQRPSRKPCTPENISLLSEPSNFLAMSEVIPDIYDGGYWWGDLRDYATRNSTNSRNLTALGRDNFSITLSQLINTFVMMQQVEPYLTPEYAPTLEEGPVDKNGERIWIVANATTSGSRRVYSISWHWMATSFASCLVLAISSLLGIIFVHLSRGPEVLGYVSTALRGYDLARVSAAMGQLDGDELSKKMKKIRLRYGWKNNGDGKYAAGIGLEEDVSRL